MDIAGYISELLEHQNELAVPGLGTFYRNRLDGYYNKEQQQFYPPSLQLQFNPELTDDDGKLIAAMTADRQTTASTARYSLDKFVTNIINLAAVEAVPFGDLGTFTTRRSQLVFMPKKLNNNNELFYGLAPVRLRRSKVEIKDGVKKPIVQMPSYTDKPSAFTQALLRGEPMPGKPLSTISNPGVVEEVEEEEAVTGAGKKTIGINTWVLVIALVILLAGIGLICAYKYNPALFDRFRSANVTPPITESDKMQKRRISDSTLKADQAKRDVGIPSQMDSATQSKILPPEVPKDTMALVLNKYKLIEGAKKEQDRYRYAGLSVDIHYNPNNDPDNPYQVAIGTYYFNVDSAAKYQNIYIKKLGLPTISIQIYPYKKRQ